MRPRRAWTCMYARGWRTCTTSRGRGKSSGAVSRRGPAGCGLCATHGPAREARGGPRRGADRVSEPANELELANDLGSLLDLERVDRDLFRGRNANFGPRRTLYGGQVAAQCLIAAAATVEDGRLPHSLHGYFLRAGRSDLPVILEVDRDRDGRSFSARHVNAVQEGEVIFSMVTSFQAESDVAGGTFDEAPR